MEIYAQRSKNLPLLHSIFYPHSSSFLLCPMTEHAFIQLRGVRQNNLKNFDLQIPLGQMTVVTGLSGSGKSSLVFDTLYAEGQRRYVETFSPYARQFLERLDPPRVDSIEGIPPAIAIQQGNTVKTSRSSVGTLTELCDYFKLVMPHRAQLICPGCQQEVRADTPAGAFDRMIVEGSGPALVTFPVAVPEKMPFTELRKMLIQQGYLRWWDGNEVRSLEGEEEKLPPRKKFLSVIQDRLTLVKKDRSRFTEAAEVAFRAGKGRLTVVTLENGKEYPFSQGRHCARCDRSFPEPIPSLFSFNNPVGACPKCRGFGRTIEIDMNLVLPNRSLSLRQGVVKPWLTGESAECQGDLLSWCKRRKVNPDKPFEELPAGHQRWVLEGDPEDPGDTGWGPWYGIRGYFKWLESKSYKMHMRVLLARYRTYLKCTDCGGSRFQPETLNYRFAGKSLGELYALSIGTLRTLIATELNHQLPATNELKTGNRQPATKNQQPPTLSPTDLLLTEIHSRLKLLGDVGLDYLTLNRTARTLSGGEVQRVHLTACLGSAMVNTLFILDEPSVGLHPKDVQSLLHVLQALRDRGNTLVVVEHEPAVIRAADHLIDLGPGAGEHGGKITYEGPLSQKVLTQSKGSLTLEYLSDRRRIPIPPQRRSVDAKTPKLTICEANENNLKNLTCEIPLGRLVCVTGVSGSGKSSLVHRVLYQNLQYLRGNRQIEPGLCRALKGHDQLGEIVLVDQSPLGRTSRSNPAVYTGAWDSVREMMGSLEQSLQRGFGPGAFSFNSGEGRCVRCGGLGFERVEMQFLPDVLMACPDCKGRRFRPELLNVKLAGKSAADLLASSVTEAIGFFRDLAIPAEHRVSPRKWMREQQNVLARLHLLQRVGLGYLRLGQPINTLSGGEAQRLKLCGFLSASLDSGPVIKKPKALLIFDEPTTGLHFDDVRQLLEVLQALVDQGHSVLIIEHNLEVIKTADWILDLGPEAGDTGGTLVASGTPEQIAAEPNSHTGRFLSSLLEGSASLRGAPPTSYGKNGITPVTAPTGINIVHAREHNLKNISLSIPRDQLVVITGLSGSGKSTLAFDLVFAEGQRRFLDCMSTYARQYVEEMPRPDIDLIEGIPPTVAIEQRISRGGWKSTVATITEAWHFIRLLYAKVGVQHCRHCHLPIQEQTEEAALRQIAVEIKKGPVRIFAPVVRGRKGFHKEVADWASSHGFKRLRVDGKIVEIEKLQGAGALERYVEHTIELDYGVFETFSGQQGRLSEALQQGHGMILLQAVGSRTSDKVISTTRACPSCGESFAPLDPKDFSFNSPAGWCQECFGYGVVWKDKALEKLEGEEETERDQRIEKRDSGDSESSPCPSCKGARLKQNALHVHVQGRTPIEINDMSSRTASDWFKKLRFKGRDVLLARDILPQIQDRLRFMREVGLDYLGLGRAAVTLSGGEAQRIRLAAQLGSNLRGVLYVLDEPTIGLHSRDNEKLLAVMERLKERGNSLVVVEHDEETMRRADWIIDMGPGAGKHGGEVVWAGSPKTLLKKKSNGASESRTMAFLRNPMSHPLRGSRRDLKNANRLKLERANLHNLKNITVDFPLGRLIAVTGVSGAGKSSLIRGSLLKALKNPKPFRKEGDPSSSPNRARVTGHEWIAAAYEVSQAPIGKTPRSCPATYLGVWDEIRKLFANTPEARIRGYTASRFSFNTGMGRCARCEGQGRIKLAMSFLPDAYVPCEICGGCRFNHETLEIRYRDRTIADVLRMSVEEAVTFLSFDSKIARPLQLLFDTGLGYLTLCQSSPTLSGGEAQRMKLVSELMRGQGFGSRIRRGPNPNNLYILEEPSIGLHFEDVARLIDVLHRLVDDGHTVILIEHNLDLIAEADLVIDIGPEGGDAGGEIVAQGTPEQVATSKGSHTGKFLKDFLARSSRAK